jgi:hypothetical protein
MVAEPEKKQKKGRHHAPSLERAGYPAKPVYA